MYNKLSYNIFYDPIIINDIFPTNPFNLHKDYKVYKLDSINVQKLAIDIATTIIKYIDITSSNSTFNILYTNSINSIVVCYAKIRIKDENTNKGKTYGYRCIVLIDKFYKRIFLLHLYKHSKGVDNLTINEKKVLQTIVDEYHNEILNQ